MPSDDEIMDSDERWEKGSAAFFGPSSKLLGGSPQ